MLKNAVLLNKNGQAQVSIQADRGRLSYDDERDEIVLKLINGSAERARSVERVIVLPEGQDPRVVCMEKTNIRYVTREQVPEPIQFASADVSFISLTKILIPARNLLKAGGQMVCLIKPQFEAGREKVGKNGVVREPKVHREVIEKIVDFADSIGFAVRGLDYSPIKGPEGNIEYLLLLCKEKEPPEEIRELGEKEAQMRLEQIQASKTGLSQREEWQKIIQETVKNSHQL